MGGVLADTEATQRQRTPGVASIPILGNMFKRKLVTKNSTEILFFITPHIYRPDYYGRPIANTPSSGPRVQSVPQPVPLGNPQSNSSAPTEYQQQDKPQGPPPTSQRTFSGLRRTPRAVATERPGLTQSAVNGLSFSRAI